MDRGRADPAQLRLAHSPPDVFPLFVEGPPGWHAEFARDGLLLHQPPGRLGFHFGVEFGLRSGLTPLETPLVMAEDARLRASMISPAAFCLSSTRFIMRACFTAARRIMIVSVMQELQPPTWKTTGAFSSGHPQTASAGPPQKVQMCARSAQTTIHWRGFCSLSAIGGVRFRSCRSGMWTASGCGSTLTWGRRGNWASDPSSARRPFLAVP